MNFETWEPVYEAILADFGFDRGADERARDALAAALGDAATVDPERLAVEGETVAVAGAGPNLEGELELAASADAVFAASTAADRLRKQGIEVDCLVTDLDKNPETVGELAAAGTPVVVHAHGDNIPAIRREMPSVSPEQVLPTTQARPRGPVRNFGGFTDGDRAAFLADHCWAEQLVFPGWRFDDPSVGPVKRRKLDWARRLLHWLERRRGDRFAVLDGHREDIDPILDR